MKKEITVLSIIVVVMSIFVLSGCINPEARPNVAEGIVAQSNPSGITGSFIDEKGCGDGLVDRDGDGFCGGVSEDCDDSDTNIYPAAKEKCDGVDNDCDGKIDEGCEAECMDECAPEGSTCTGTTMKKCLNIDQDPCTELVLLECTFGCANYDKCRAKRLDASSATGEFMREGDRAAASEAWSSYEQELADEACNGELIETVYWQQKGSLCKRDLETGSPRRGYITPLRCCQVFTTGSKCAIDTGEVPGQYEGYTTDFRVIECYSETV